MRWAASKLTLFTIASTRKANKMITLDKDQSSSSELSQDQNQFKSENCVFISDQILNKESEIVESKKTSKKYGIYLFFKRGVQYKHTFSTHINYRNVGAVFFKLQGLGTNHHAHDLNTFQKFSCWCS
jgi:hypothetical protein